jgi:hypothetical protein
LFGTAERAAARGFDFGGESKLDAGAIFGTLFVAATNRLSAAPFIAVNDEDAQCSASDPLTPWAKHGDEVFAMTLIAWIADVIAVSVSKLIGDHQF